MKTSVYLDIMSDLGYYSNFCYFIAEDLFEETTWAMGSFLKMIDYKHKEYFKYTTVTAKRKRHASFKNSCSRVLINEW